MILSIEIGKFYSRLINESNHISMTIIGQNHNRP